MNDRAMVYYLLHAREPRLDWQLTATIAAMLIMVQYLSTPNPKIGKVERWKVQVESESGIFHSLLAFLLLASACKTRFQIE